MKIWNKSLRNKLILASLLCLLLPSVLTLIASDAISRNIVRSQVSENEKKSLELTDVYISGLFDNMIRISNSIMFDKDITLALKGMWQRTRIGQIDYAEDTQAIKDVSDKLRSIAYSMDDVNIMLVTQEGKYFTNDSNNFSGEISPSGVLQLPWMKKVLQLPAFDIEWVGLISSKPTPARSSIPHSLAIARNLRLTSKESYAYLVVSIDTDQLSEIFRHDVGRQETLLLDPQGRILAGKDSAKIGSTFVFSGRKTDPDGELVQIGSEQFLLSGHDLTYGGYRIVSLRPYKEAVSQIHNVYWLSFTLQISAVLLFLILFIYMIRQFTKPVVKLGRVAARVEGGDLSVRSRIRGSDEIGHLGQLFDGMLERIEWMIRQITAEQTQKRKAELAMLQAQINPHFLFNILNSIRLRILMKGDSENAELLSALSGLLRMTIQRQDEFTALHEELNVVQKYVELLNFRQQEKAGLHIHAGSNCLAVRVPRFMLQPVIENAYIHGLNQEGGNIRIYARKADHLLIIAVEDDGKGIDDALLERLRSEMTRIREALPGPQAARLSSIGLSNVYERLYLIYGNRFSLSINSEAGRGTTLEIVIPADGPGEEDKEMG